MDEYLRRERERQELQSKEALEQLMFKDEIINDLRTQLEQEQNDNILLKKKCNDMEARLLSIDTDDYANTNNKLHFSNV